MYKTFIVDELNHIIYDCSNLTEKQIDNILKEHEEWRITCLKVF
nr:MAG TPA: DNA-directed RNA polymerase II subunit [Caudoviricetes sp.]